MIYGKYLQVSITYFDAVIKRKAIRDIAKVSYLDHTYLVLVQNKCLKFVDIVKLKTLIIIYKAKNNMFHINLQLFSITKEEIHSYGTRYLFNSTYMDLLVIHEDIIMSISHF